MTATEFRARLDALSLCERSAARICGVHERTVRRWSAGDRAVPETVVRLLALLDVPGVREALDSMRAAA